MGKLVEKDEKELINATCPVCNIKHGFTTQKQLIETVNRWYDNVKILVNAQLDSLTRRFGK